MLVGAGRTVRVKRRRMYEFIRVPLPRKGWGEGTRVKKYRENSVSRGMRVRKAALHFLKLSYYPDSA